MEIFSLQTGVFVSTIVKILNLLKSYELSTPKQPKKRFSICAKPPLPFDTLMHSISCSSRVGRLFVLTQEVYH